MHPVIIYFPIIIQSIQLTIKSKESKTTAQVYTHARVQINHWLVQAFPCRSLWWILKFPSLLFLYLHLSHFILLMTSSSSHIASKVWMWSSMSFLNPSTIVSNVSFLWWSSSLCILKSPSLCDLNSHFCKQYCQDHISRALAEFLTIILKVFNDVLSCDIFRDGISFVWWIILHIQFSLNQFLILFNFSYSKVLFLMLLTSV